jgi:signal transduction histidine kinase
MSRILVVEDSQTQLEEIRIVLESEGFTVDTASDGVRALARLQAARADLVLTDVLMPDLSGYELCRRIKTHPRTKHIPVVLLTQLNDPLDILRGLESGADNFITKPFDANYLVRRVRGILDNRSQQEGSAPAAGTTLSFRGRGVTITTDKEQILDLLFATLEEVVYTKAREKEVKAANVALTEADRRKDEHLAMLAHELRNPLAPLLTSLHVLREAAPNSPSRAPVLDAMERQLRHLTRLVDDLVDVSRITHGKVQLRRERLDLARLIRNTADDRRPLLEQAGLDLTVETSETPVWILGDATRLAQVLNNLLDNATKFTERGGRVSVRLTADEARGQAWLIVADTGQGINSDMLGRLWGLFVQADSSLDRPGGGLGLGLSVVKGLVELHHGEVGATSEGVGRGAEFTVRLPTEREPAALAAVPSSPSGGGEGLRLRVLVVEDSRDAAASLRLVLEMFGHEVRVAHSGPDGVREATAWRPVMVLSDVDVPGFDRCEVARRIRRTLGLGKALLAALTDYCSDDDRCHGQEAGFA